MDLRTALKGFVAERSPELLKLFRRARRAAKNYVVPPGRAFDRIYRENLWGSAESRSGSGSTAAATALICEELPRLIERLHVRSLVDAPCGDFWIRRANLTLASYVGIDIVDALIEENQRVYGRPGRTFQTLDLTENVPPRADLILCRDLFIHLSYRHGRRVLRNFHRSGSEYLLSSQCPDHQVNEDIATGSFRLINLRVAPFDLPEPLVEIDDRASPRERAGPRRTMALWRLADLHIR